MAKVLVTESYLTDMANAIREKNGQSTEYLPSEMAGAIRDIPVGTGDMEKSVYDTNDNGIVDNAEAVNGHTVAKDVPADAKFTDTVYDDTALSGRVTSAEGNISSLGAAVASKANQSDLSTLAGIVAVTGDDIDALETRMTDAEDDLSHLPEPAEEDGVFVVTQNNGNMELTEMDTALGDSDVIQNKADDDGTYPEMAVGELLSSTYLTDQTPYLLRQSGGGMAIGGREWDEIAGGTVAWNQLVQNGAGKWGLNNASSGSVTWDETNTVATILNTQDSNNQFLPDASNRPIVTNHIVLCGMDVKLSSDAAALSNVIGFYANGIRYAYSQATASWQTFKAIVNWNSANSNFFAVKDMRSSGWDAYQVRNPIFIDLTAMFGTTIADHIYALEHATAGAGVAWLRNNGFMLKDYYAYNAGSLESVQTSAHKMVGFNQWDEQWENGYYNTNTGVPGPDANSIRCENPITVMPNTYYYLANTSGAGLGRVLFYDGSDNFISSVIFAVTSSRFLTPENCMYVRFYMNSAYGKVYNHDICINLSDPSRNGTYEPYKEWTYPLDSSLTLRGITKKADDGSLYYDGDTYQADGTVTRRYAEVDLGTLNWIYQPTGNAFAVSWFVNKPYANSYVPPILCNKYPVTLVSGSWAIINNYPDKTISYHRHGDNAVDLFIKDSAYTDATAFKQMLTDENVKLVYELAEPTTEPAIPFPNPQIVDRYGTEEYITTGIVPVGHNTKYTLDLLAKLENLPDQTEYQTLLASIAPPENGTTASKAYSAGQYFMKGAQFCKAKTAIASGATFTLNTNYELTTVAAELYAALNS